MSKSILENQLKLPLGWSCSTIENMINTDGVFVDGDWVESKDQDPNGNIRLTQLADIGINNFKNKSNRFMTIKKAKELNCTILQENDILVARMPKPLGRACLFPKFEQKCVTVVDVAIIRIGKIGCVPKWLMYVINSPKIQNEIFELQSGTTRKRISRMNLSKILFLIPPFNEQKRIVKKTEELFSILEHTEKSLVRTLSLLESYKISLTEQIYVKNSKFLSTLGVKSNDWDNCPISDVGKILTGNTPKTSRSEFYSNDYEFFKPADLGDGFNVDSSKSKLSKLGLQFGRFIPKNSVLVTCIGATIGKTGINRIDGAINQQINAIIPNEKIDFEFLYYLCISTSFQNLIKKSSSATTMPIINKSKFSKLEIPLPSISIQKKIVRKLNIQFSVINEMIYEIHENQFKLKSLKNLILKQVFEGKLVPQDPNDEHAEIFLQKIKQEKEQLIQKQKESRRSKNDK